MSTEDAKKERLLLKRLTANSMRNIFFNYDKNRTDCNQQQQKQKHH